MGARRAARVDAVRSPRWRAATDGLADELPGAWVERGARRRRASRSPTTFSRAGARAVGRGRRGASRSAAAVSRHTVGLMARTKLVCTLGPASATPKLVQGLVRAGASVFRLNFSHGTPEEHARMVALVRDAEAALGTPLAVLVDLPGPKVRLGRRRSPTRSRSSPGSGSSFDPAGGADARGGEHDLPEPRGRPARGRPRAARRRRGRADRHRDRDGGRRDRVRRGGRRSQRPGGERPGRAARPARRDRPRPRGARARPRSRRRLHRAVVRPRTRRRARAPRPRWATGRADRREDRDAPGRRGRRVDPGRGRRADDRPRRPRRGAPDGGDPADPEGARARGPRSGPARRSWRPRCSSR